MFLPVLDWMEGVREAPSPLFPDPLQVATWYRELRVFSINEAHGEIRNGKLREHDFLLHPFPSTLDVQALQEHILQISAGNDQGSAVGTPGAQSQHAHNEPASPEQGAPKRHRAGEAGNNSPGWGAMRRNLAARLAAAADTAGQNSPTRQRAHLAAGARAIIAAKH
eukprot:7664980-Heterocapsa_arctica.AAC.1